MMQGLDLCQPNAADECFAIMAFLDAQVTSPQQEVAVLDRCLATGYARVGLVLAQAERGELDAVTARAALMAGTRLLAGLHKRACLGQFRMATGIALDPGRSPETTTKFPANEVDLAAYVRALSHQIKHRWMDPRAGVPLILLGDLYHHKDQRNILATRAEGLSYRGRFALAERERDVFRLPPYKGENPTPQEYEDIGRARMAQSIFDYLADHPAAPRACCAGTDGMLSNAISLESTYR